MSQTARGQSGFTLLELLVSMGIMLIVLGATTQIMMSSMQAQVMTKQMLDMNGHLRAAIDLIQRDLLQVGQGLPVGRRIGIPNTGADPIARPGPAASGACPGVTNFPDDPTLPAISVGPGLGAILTAGGGCSDVITTLSADNMFGPVNVASIAADGRSLVIHSGFDNEIDIADDPDIRGDNLRAGDLLMITKGNASVLMQVSAVNGQQVTFGPGSANDPLGLNQFDTSLGILGTINQLKAQAPADSDAPQTETVNSVLRQRRGPSEATRIRMVTYYVEPATGLTPSRLMRRIGGQPPNVVAMGVQAFQISYDIADQATNPTNVRMNANDILGVGACNPQACSENQIRKVNVLLSMTANDPRLRTALDSGRQAQNTLYTQVSLRSMAFVDRYR